MTPYPKFPPHRDQHVFVKEERNVRPNDKFIRITLVLEDNPGVMLESPESSSRVTKRRKEYRLYVKPGTTVHVVDDPANPRLSKEQVEGIARHYQTIVESRVDDVNNVFGEACSSVLQRNHPSFGRVDELRKLFKRSAFLRSLVEAHWLECYQPVPIPTQSNMNLVKKICDGRFLVHAYWRRFQASGQYVVRYSMDLSPNPQDSSVWIYLYSGTTRHELHGPLQPDSLVTPDALERLRATVTDLLRNQQDTNSTYRVLSHPTNGTERRLRWHSVEVNVFSRQWLPQIHSATPAKFQKRVETFLLCNNRLDDSARLSLDCVRLVVSMLFEVEGVDPVPVFRCHRICQRGPHKPDTRPPTDPQLSLVEGISQAIGMGDYRSFCPRMFENFGLHERGCR